VVEARGRSERLKKRAMCTALAFLGILSSLPVSAQNAAQRAALAQLGKQHARSVSPTTTGGEATTSSLNMPGGLAVDSAGNIYIADTDDNTVLEVSTLGIVTTVAGTGLQSYGGDGGPATSAFLDAPAGIAIDANNNLYICDTHNNRVREVVGGIINTIAGTGAAGFSGDGTAATGAMLDLPTAVAVDSKGNVYIADTDNNRIREIVGTTINTVAGNGLQIYSGDGGLATAAGIDSPNGVAVDAQFNLYIGDTHNQRVRMVTVATGIITTLAGTGFKGFTADGPSSAAALARPLGVAVNGSGNVYVADSDNNRIRSIGGNSVTTIAGNGIQGFSGDGSAATSASLDSPQALTTNGAAVMFADTGNNRIRSVSNGMIDTVAGDGSSGTESLVVNGSPNSVYGTGSLSAMFSNGALTGTGLVTFYDGVTSTSPVIGTSPLSSNMASISTTLLSAGTHYVVASYAGDGNNPAINSGMFVLVVTPVQLTAVANSVSLLYGQAIPALTGTLTGLLPQDAGNVTAVFSTTATMTSAPGAYPITVALQGSAAGNYTVAPGSGSGSAVIAKAPSLTTLVTSTTTPISGTPFVATATVISTTSGTPTGTVNFMNGAVLLNTAPVALVNGVASFNISTLPVGPLDLAATYSGDTDFLTSSSSALTGSVPSPDFTITMTPSTQTVAPGSAISFTASLTPTNPTFDNPVSLTVSGLPAGATATFSPASIATGSGPQTTTLTIQTASAAALREQRPSLAKRMQPFSLALLVIPFYGARRMRKNGRRMTQLVCIMFVVLGGLFATATMTGCGSSNGFFDQAQQNYTVIITATSGNVQHTAQVTLNVQ
jgi:sugar lactone lactonase YvrE